VHSLWHPLPGAFKDYIAVPKYNLYRSLHTEVVGPDEQIIGLFIRTSNQHRVSEYGLAAHVADASSAADREKVTRRPDLEWFGRLLAWQGQAKAEDYLDSLRIDLIPGTILTFTSAGQSIVLPRGATPIDFAYELSADTGNSAIGAMVDGRLRPLTAPLKDGSVVEILTSEAGRPEASWLEIAKTAAARIQIGLWLNERQTERVAATGRSMLAGEAKSRQLDLLAAETNGAVTAIARRDGYPSLDALYAAVANNDIDPTSLAADITTLMSDGTSGRQG
jgi:GTP pyrophosphokinase